MTSTEAFCKILRQRSAENLSSGILLFNNSNYGQVMSILRQELDSLVRIIFLLDNPIHIRQHFINQTLNNEKWVLPNSRTIITDRQMVNLADKLYGWTNSVYKLGCAFIHLSPLADYNNTNPFTFLTTNEIDNIKRHLYDYHSFPLSEDLSIESIKPYLTKVLKKVADNLECYIQDLENNYSGNLHDL